MNDKPTTPLWSHVPHLAQVGTGLVQHLDTRVSYRMVGFGVLTAMKMSMLVVRVVMPCGPVGRYRRFGGTYLHLQPWKPHFGERNCLHLQPGRWREYISLKSWYLPRSPHGITAQKNNTGGNGDVWVIKRITRCGTLIWWADRQQPVFCKTHEVPCCGIPVPK
jgi:hypothetical protein